MEKKTKVSKTQKPAIDGLVLKTQKGSRFCLKHFKFRIKPKNPLWDKWLYCPKCYKEAGSKYGK